MTARHRPGRPAAAGASGEFGHVLAGVMLDGAAARLAGMLDPAFLAEAGWDPASADAVPARQPSAAGPHAVPGRWLPGHRPGNESRRVCQGCFARLQRAGMSASRSPPPRRLPRRPRPPGAWSRGASACRRCGRQRMCEPHSRSSATADAITLEQFLADPAGPAAAALGVPCAACPRAAERAAATATPMTCGGASPSAAAGAGQRRWQPTEPAVSEPGQVSLRALPRWSPCRCCPGLQPHPQRGEDHRRGPARGLRHAAAAAVRLDPALPPGLAPGGPGRCCAPWPATSAAAWPIPPPSRTTTCGTWPSSATAGGCRSPASAAVAGRAAKRWAAGELPRHRGGGASRVRAKINALGRLSQSLRGGRSRDDPAALGRADIENFLQPARLPGIGRANQPLPPDRDLPGCAGRPGRDPRPGPDPARPARGRAARRLHHRTRRHPRRPERGEPGRDLPPEIMAALCANLRHPAARRGQGRHPDRDRHRAQARGHPRPAAGLPGPATPDGGAVLVYDNAKAGRLGRRLPISNATAEVIPGQQAPGPARFPHAPAAS